MRRREMNFPAVRWNESATMTPAEGFRLAGKEQSHRVVDDEDRWSTVATWTAGVDEVTASSSQAYADAVPPLLIGAHPGAALDRDPGTAWVSAREEGPDGQWWQADLTTPATVGTVSVAVGARSVPVDRLEISAGGQTRTVDAPAPGTSASYAVGLPLTSTLRVTTRYDGPLLSGSVALSEVAIDDLHPQRLLTLPEPEPGVPVDAVVLSRDPDRLPCAPIGDAFPCEEILTGPGEDGDTLARAFSVGQPARYTLAATASLRRTPTAWGPLLAATGVSVETVPGDTGDVATAVGALADGDPTTTWVAAADQPVVRVRLARQTRLSRLQLLLNPGAAASAPARIEVMAGGRRRVLDLDEQGRASLPRWRVKRLRVRLDSTYPAFSVQGSSFVEMPPGVSELRINGEPLTSSVFRTLDVPCGSGPKINLGGKFYDTSVLANVRDLLRGASVPLQICGEPVATLAGSESLVVGPTELLRVDAVRLGRAGPDGTMAAPTTASMTAPMTAPMTVVRDGGGSPTRVDLPARAATQVLSLPQNDNPGWVATLDGQRLPHVRVEGWKQGWLVPPGAAGAVRLRFEPAGLFRTALLVGGLLPLLVLLAALPGRRRGRDLPALAPGRAGLLDAVVVLGVAGWLTGWVGLVLVAVVGLGVWRWGALDRAGGWGVPAGIALLLASVALSWGPLKDLDWALAWGQAWAMAAVACLSGALLAGWGAAGRGRGPAGPRAFRRARGPAPSAGSST
ncbi:MAG: discoidin domain-containing protein [Nocardioides sp.]